MSGNNLKTDDIYLGPKPGVKATRLRMPFIIVLVAILIAAGGYLAFVHLKFARSPKAVVISDTIPLKIYYPVSPAKLGIKEVNVKAALTDKEKADAIMSGLKDAKILPSTLLLEEFVCDPDGTLILNLSPDTAKLDLAPMAEIHTVYSIVNTFLANFQKARKVQLLAGGQPFFTIAGTVYTYKPLEFNSQILED
ncbi:MAG: GerMN domain-containing protein [Syntrophorhabdaceae bacterium]